MNREANSKIGPIVGKVDIVAIRLKCAELSSEISSPAEVTIPVLSLEYSADASERASDGSFCVTAKMIGRIRPKDTRKTAQAPLLISATFEINYALPKEISVTTEDLSAFAALNGVFNVWPYWREFFQSSLVRMGLPPIQLPVLRGFPNAVRDEPSHFSLHGDPSNPESERTAERH